MPKPPKKPKLNKDQRKAEQALRRAANGVTPSTPPSGKGPRVPYADTK